MFEIEHMNETFDYSLVDNATAEFLKEREYTINGIAEDARIKIGRELKKAQDKLANHHEGVFVKWYESGGLDRNQVYYYINLNQFSTNLENAQKDNFLNAPKSLQKEVMKKNAPEDLKQKVLDGDITTNKEYQQLQKEKTELEQQKELLAYIYYTLEMNINDKSKTYEHSVEENGIAETFEVNREQHLQEVMYWAAQEIEKHFDVTVKK